MSAAAISVCICTHAPDLNLLSRVLEALSRQTLDARLWEVLLVENSEEAGLDVSILSSLPCPSRLALERKQGKVHAMVAAADAVLGNWIVFVDDDNILSQDYLSNLLKLSEAFPQIGVFSASIEGEFAVPVPEWAKPYLRYLAVREIDKPKWANCHPAPVGPVGAGMCVRNDILRSFAAMYRRGEISASLGRTKGSLSAGTDDTVFMDIAFKAGYGCGAFPELRHTHVIPASRLELSYLKRLVHDLTASHTVLGARWTTHKPSRARALVRLLLDCLSTTSLHSPEQRTIEIARAQGRYVGIKTLCRMGRNV